jgi:hypothetical protein
VPDVESTQCLEVATFDPSNGPSHIAPEMLSKVTSGSEGIEGNES